MSPITDESLASADLLSFSDGIHPYSPGDASLEQGWNRGSEWFATTVKERVGFTGGRVLDLLCGHGRWSVFLAEVNDEVVGVDRLPVALDIARGLSTSLGLVNTSFHQAEVGGQIDLPALEPDSFDYVWLYGALQYLDRFDALNEVYRLLRPNGRVFVSNYNSSGLMLEHVQRGAERGMINEGSSQWALDALQRGEGANGKPNYLTLNGLDRLARQFGFDVVGGAADGQLDLRNKDDIAAPLTEPVGQLPTIEFVLEKRGETEPVKRRLRYELGSDSPDPGQTIRELLSDSPPLLSALADLALESEHRVRANALHVLGRLGPVAVDALIRVATAENEAPAAAEIAGEELKKIGTSALGPICAAMVRQDGANANVLSKALQVIDPKVYAKLA